ncbi:hypothetical protein H6P81_010445 [Aristolochia fimbriata]|uniref:Uncharacterized protein n=1 Tax=Aristolochia fimbriata TaxID=158543 RepID=A0AAV7ENS1_ARIFI|nr:hypothetical protein H6P81_010445 [Aristolochia fimbriata]
MTTLQKFKLLATQCAVAGSPSRSPSPGHVFHLRRRKTLRHLLTRTVSRRRCQSSDAPPDCGKIAADRVEKKAYISHTLKDLFVSSPPPPPMLEDNSQSGGNVAAAVERVRMPLRTNRVGAGTGARIMTGALRYRLLRRAWRPVLGSSKKYFQGIRVLSFVASGTLQNGERDLASSNVR